jgi:UDP-glucose 4-epimerase
MLAFAYHRQFDVPVTVFRLFNTVGPRQTGDYGMVVPRLVRQALAGEPLTVFGNGEQTRCFCDVHDAVRAIAGLVSNPAAIGGIFNIGSTRELSIRKLADIVLRVVGDEDAAPEVSDQTPRIVLVPYEEAYPDGFEDMRRRLPDIRRIHEATGWQPTTPLEDTLRAVVHFELESARATTSLGRRPT